MINKYYNTINMLFLNGLYNVIFVLYYENMIIPFKYIEPYSKRPKQRFYLSCVGIYEKMETESIYRPEGTWDWLFMFFHDPVTLVYNGETIECVSNTLVIWDDTQGHQYGNTDSCWEHSWMHCQGSVVPDSLQQVGLKTGVYQNLECSSVLEKYLPMLYEEKMRRDCDMVLLEYLFTCLLREISRLQNPHTSALPKRIHTIKQFLDIHYQKNLSLNDLCLHVNMSKPHLISEFRKHMDMPPIDYLIQTRLGHAKSLLLNRNFSISEIAERVGYMDIYHFSKLFKKHTGHSPSAFRGKLV